MFVETRNYKGYGEEQVIGTLSIVKIGDSFSGLIIEVQEDEAYGSIMDLRRSLLIIIMIIIGMFILLTNKMAKSISKPIGEVMKLTNELAESMEEHTASTEEITSASEGLDGLAKHLKDLVGQFKI